VGEDCAGATRFAAPDDLDLNEHLCLDAARRAGLVAGQARFADALIWNWVIGGTDAHAKNYSLLLAGDQVRLARCTTSHRRCPTARTNARCGSR
jgi:hypothetical protein